jgi:hypothetical protein
MLSDKAADKTAPFFIAENPVFMYNGINWNFPISDTGE